MAYRRNETSFKAGTTPNPFGRKGNPDKVRPEEPREQRDVVVMARRHTKRAIKTLVSIMSDPNENATARVKAAETILSRGWGQAAQQRLDLVAHLNDAQLAEAAAAVIAKRMGQPGVSAHSQQPLAITGGVLAGEPGDLVIEGDGL